MNEDPVLSAPEDETQNPYVAIMQEGLTEEEKAKNEPDELGSTQNLAAQDALREKWALEIIQAGLGEHYQLECTSCGHTWYVPRDEVSMLTIGGPSSANNVGAAPSATVKFEDVEKKLMSPRESERSGVDPLKKSTQP
ncbi:hypothetical protein RJ641_001254 [Dillenia turbinata]|uniref:Uncharacterized protein n=1 Tax=Dillenia turbinata TaxID=194707 RepID=A0AAN8WFE3_9MAGN